MEEINKLKTQEQETVMNTLAKPVMEDLAKSGAVSLYEYVSALVRRAGEAQWREAELALLSLRQKIIDRARGVGAAWQAWSDYWNEASAWYRKISLVLDSSGK